MARYISRIEDIINQIAPEWTLTHFIPRGFPYFIDSNLRGRIRFAKRTGSFLPNITGENLTALSEAVVALQTVITVGRILPLFEPGVVISIGPGLELKLISDIGDDGEVVLSSPLRSDHAAGESVQLYAVPAQVVGSVAKGQTVFNITSTVPVFQGDKLWIETVAGSLESAVHFSINTATPINPWPNPSNGIFTTTLTITPGMPRAFATGETIYLRAFPAYMSTRLNIPTQANSSNTVGPFVVDYLSGRLNDGPEITERLNLQAYTSLGVPTLGSNPIAAAKNYPIINMPIPNTTLLFWDVIKGKVSYKNGKLLMQTDANGHFAISTPLVPAFPNNSKTNTGSWKIPVILRTPPIIATGLLRFKFAPNAYQDFTIISDSPTVVQVSVGAQDATRCEIVLVATPNAFVEMDNWFPQANQIGTIEYTIISDAVGDTNWQSGSLQIKPYFLTLDALIGKFDFDRFNNGRIML